MKTLFKIPVLLLALMLFISCGDSKKEKEEEKLSPVEQAAVDGKKQAEMACESIKVANEEGYDSEKMKKIMKDSQDFGDKMYSTYGKEGTASDEAKKAFEEALKVAMEDCMKSVY